jgi:uncharacterized protein
MQLLEGLEALDLGLFIRAHSTLVISDLQLGYEEHLNRKGYLLPRQQYELLMKRIEPMLAKARPRSIVLNGDIKHEFGDISETEWRLVLKFLDFLSGKCEVKIIKGNHDVQLFPILKKRGFETIDHLSLDDIYICHGDIIPSGSVFKRSRTVIIGHEHPALGLRDSGRIERYKCFLRGIYEKKDIIVLPSCNPLIEGSDMLSEKPLSPFLKGNLDDFSVFVVSGKILDFGKISELRKRFD